MARAARPFVRAAEPRTKTAEPRAKTAKLQNQSVRPHIKRAKTSLKVASPSRPPVSRLKTGSKVESQQRSRATRSRITPSRKPRRRAKPEPAGAVQDEDLNVTAAALLPGSLDEVKPKRKSKAQAATTETAAAIAAGKSGAKPKALVQRVYNTIDMELTKLEQQKGVSSQDRERASRALAQMVNSLEKAIDMQREIIGRSATRGSAKDTEALRHAEDLRRQIAERLERVNGLRKSRRRAGGAE